MLHPPAPTPLTRLLVWHYCYYMKQVNEFYYYCFIVYIVYIRLTCGLCGDANGLKQHLIQSTEATKRTTN